MGSKSEYSNIQIISKLCELMGKDPEASIQFVTDRPFNDSRYLINYEKIMKLGWSQEVFIEDQWETVIEWYAQNADRYRHVEL